jgi:hypothetical protein
MRWSPGLGIDATLRDPNTRDDIQCGLAYNAFPRGLDSVMCSLLKLILQEHITLVDIVPSLHQVPQYHVLMHVLQSRRRWA